MDFKQWLEMAATVKHVGNWERQNNLPGIGGFEPSDKKNLGWHHDDFGILTSKAGVEKIEQKWSKVPEQIDLYVVRNSRAYKTFTTGQIGKIQPDFLKSVGVEVVSDRDPQATNQVVIDPEAISCFYTNNMGGERMPFNYWTAAHRLGHALRNERAYEEFTNHLDEQISNIAEDVYGIQRTGQYGYIVGNQMSLRDVALAIGTMKSCRDRTLNNWFEFHHELLAQYIIEGAIRFNPLPRGIGLKMAWGHGSPTRYARHGVNMEDVNEEIAGLARDMTYYAKIALDHAVGNIYII